MNFIPTPLAGAYLIDIKKLEDERGFFARSFCAGEFREFDLSTHVVQANLSFNKTRGTLRGMHMQLAPHEESKLVRCTRGAIFDVIVDLRPQSETYKQWFGAELTADSYRMLFVPEGFAHGFITLEDNTDVCYQVTAAYTPASERGYRWDDPAFNIQWPIQPLLISAKDALHPLFEERADVPAF